MRDRSSTSRSARRAVFLFFLHFCLRPGGCISSPVGLAVGGTMQTATNQALPTHTCTTHPYDAHATPPCRCVRQWPSHAPQKLQDFDDCDYSVHAAEASVRHGSPACAYCSFPQQPMRLATAPEADLSAQGCPMGPKREPSSFGCRRDAVAALWLPRLSAQGLRAGLDAAARDRGRLCTFHARRS